MHLPVFVLELILTMITNWLDYGNANKVTWGGLLSTSVTKCKKHTSLDYIHPFKHSMFTVFLFYKEKELFTGEGCVEMDIPWQLCRTIGPLLSKRFPLASAKAQPRGDSYCSILYQHPRTLQYTYPLPKKLPTFDKYWYKEILNF